MPETPTSPVDPLGQGEQFGGAHHDASREVHPSSAPRRHQPRSNPSGTASVARTAAVEHSAARNRLAVSTNAC